jgi:hypothetical protein
VSLDPSPDEARELLERELAGSEYPHPSLLDRFWEWLGEQLGDASAAATGSPVGILLALVAGAVVFVALLGALSRVRRDRHGHDEAPGILETTLSARDLRRRAEDAVREGRHHHAVADGARAVARGGVERGLVDDSPGRTSHEVLAELAERFPSLAEDLRGTADLFDRVVYGGRGAGRDDATRVLELEAAARAARPEPAAGERSALVAPR